MDDFADVYYVDTRNATNDHRTGGPVIQGGGTTRPWRPSGTRVIYAPQPAAPMQPQIVVAQPAPSPVGALFGKLTPGQVIELVAALFAALQPLPAAPTPTKDASTDAANMILFQDALAKHAKRDEQVRTIGNLAARLVG
jgi:hypothetical protein